MTLSDEFQSDVEALPAYTPGLPEYAKFVERYGTHCLLSSYFGGKGVSQVYVNTKEAQTYSTSDISIQAGIKYKFAAQISSDDSQSWFNGYDQTRSEIHTFMEGGDPGLADDLAHWGDWISSFFQYPVSVYNDQFKMTLVPIEQLVPAAKRDDVAQALADHLAAIPYPDDPDCSATVLCMGDDRFDGSCCTKDYPSCCYQNDATQCYSNTNDVCCGDDHACSAGHQCCGNGCTGGSSRCCNDADGGDRSCSSPFINCCADKSMGCCSDGHSTCCNLENQQYCCPDGWGCIDLWPFGVGCNPLGDEDPADTVKINATQQVIDGIKMYPRKSSGHKKAKFPATNMNDFVELMAARS